MHRIVASTFLTTLCLWLAAPDPTVASAELETIDKIQCYRKAALDLSHDAPDADVIAALRSGATSFEAAVQTLLVSDKFRAVARKWYMTEYVAPGEDTPEDADDAFLLEPLYIAEHLLHNRIDYRLLVSGDFDVAKDGTVTLNDGQKGAGILGTKHMLSKELGLENRNWAGYIERTFTGIVLEAVSIDDEADIDLSGDGLRANPACAGCHFDPLYGIDLLAKFRACYDDEGTRITGCTEESSTFLELPATGLEGLGEILANSNEFKSQTVNFFFKKLFGRRMFFEEAEFYARAAVAYEEAGFDALALLEHLVSSEAYCRR